MGAKILDDIVGYVCKLVMDSLIRIKHYEVGTAVFSTSWVKLRSHYVIL